MSNLIPHIRGPKLAPFNGEIQKLELVRLLGPDHSQSQSSGSTPHSKVFQVKIEQKRYALKIFNFFTISELRPFVYDGEDLLTDNIVRHHLDPFYAECRAFGLLVEKKKEDKLAVRCHGWALLPDALERRIHDEFGINDWNRHEEHLGQPLRAILKDYIVYNSVCGRRRLSKMKENIIELNELGIYNMDIREDNYRGGRLFDFSLAITSPHISLSLKLRSRQNVERDMKYDLEAFQDLETKERNRRKDEEVSARAQGLRRELRQRNAANVGQPGQSDQVKQNAQKMLPTSVTTAESLLLALPPEISHVILTNVVEDMPDTMYLDCRSVAQSNLCQPKLAKVNRQFRNEVLPIFY